MKDMDYYEFEIGKFADKLVREIFKLKPGEQFVITADTRSNARTVNATAAAAFAAGAKPVVIWIAYPLGWGKSSDPNLPVDVLSGALQGADAWVEFHILHGSTPYHNAMNKNKKLRYFGLGGSFGDPDVLVRTIGRVDHGILKQLMNKTSAILKTSKHVRFVTGVGNDLEFDMPKTEDGQHDPNHPVGGHDGYADKPGPHMMIGQLAWAPKLDTVNGKIVFDGSLKYGNMAGGIIKEPICLTIEAGQIVKFEGGKETFEFEAWLKSLNHPQMLRLAHTAIGLNPGAKISDQSNLESERFWGSTEWGIGSIVPDMIGPDGVDAPAHCDGVCLDTSIWLDGKLFMEHGKFLNPDLIELAKKLGK